MNNASNNTKHFEFKTIKSSVSSKSFSWLDLAHRQESIKLPQGGPKKIKINK